MNGDIWRNVCYRYVMRDARQPYLAYLDSLRGLAALGVAAFWHYQQFSSIRHVSFERPARNWLRALPSRRKPSWSERPA